MNSVRISSVAKNPLSAFFRSSQRFAGSHFAYAKVKKYNWIEQNEILRENKFKSWTFEKSNRGSLFVALVAFPVFLYKLLTTEYENQKKLFGLPRKGCNKYAYIVNKTSYRHFGPMK